VKRAVIKKKISKKDLEELAYMLMVHWPYHIGQIKRVFKRIDIDSPFGSRNNLEMSIY
jgi:hypothetical protein